MCYPESWLLEGNPRRLSILPVGMGVPLSLVFFTAKVERLDTGAGEFPRKRCPRDFRLWRRVRGLNPQVPAQTQPILNRLPYPLGITLRQTGGSGRVGFAMLLHPHFEGPSFTAGRRWSPPSVSVGDVRPENQDVSCRLVLLGFHRPHLLSVR